MVDQGRDQGRRRRYEGPERFSIQRRHGSGGPLSRRRSAGQRHRLPTSPSGRARSSIDLPRPSSRTTPSATRPAARARSTSKGRPRPARSRTRTSRRRLTVSRRSSSTTALQPSDPPIERSNVQGSGPRPHQSFNGQPAGRSSPSTPARITYTDRRDGRPNYDGTYSDRRATPQDKSFWQRRRSQDVHLVNNDRRRRRRRRDACERSLRPRRSTLRVRRRGRPGRVSPVDRWHREPVVLLHLHHRKPHDPCGSRARAHAPGRRRSRRSADSTALRAGKPDPAPRLRPRESERGRRDRIGLLHGLRDQPGR